MSSSPLSGAGETLADRFRAWAGSHTHLYGHAVRAMAADWEAGGVVRRICRGYEDAPGEAVIQLRLLAGVFRLVLTGQAPELVRFYPNLGGTAAPGDAWPAMEAVITDHADDLHDALATAPQTNEIGRSAALLAGLLDLRGRTDHQQIRLLELGASAGLNLLLDHYAVYGPGWRYGPENSPVQLTDAVRGEIPLRPFVIVTRSGCDLHPVDPATPEGRLLLTSFVWPFDVHRHVRLAAAFAVVERVGSARVDEASAANWLTEQLAGRPEQGVLPVVFNSITAQYWPAEEIRRVADVLDAYGSGAPLARVALEFRPNTPTYEPPELTTSYWPGDGSPVVVRRIGRAHHHGIPVELET